MSENTERGAQIFRPEGTPEPQVPFDTAASVTADPFMPPSPTSTMFVPPAPAEAQPVTRSSAFPVVPGQGKVVAPALLPDAPSQQFPVTPGAHLSAKQLAAAEKSNTWKWVLYGGGVVGATIAAFVTAYVLGQGPAA